MQTDLHDFLIRLANTVAMALVPVAFIALLSMPASLHHHLGTPPAVDNAPAAHMT